MAKKREGIFNEVQIGIIKAIVGEAVINVGTKMRYTEAPSLNDPNDIPNWATVLNITGGGLSSLEFSASDLLGSDGDFNLPYVLPDIEAVVVMRIDYDDRPSEIKFPQYSFEDEAILGFVNKDNVTNIKVWSTGSNVIPPPTPPAPIFSLQPSPSVSILQGKTLTLTVTSSNTDFYQWYKDGVVISGANTSTLTVTDFNPSKEGAYYVIANGAGGSTQSSSSLVTNDAGVLINNFTATDLDGGSHTGLTLTATDGTDVLNINVGTQGRLRSGVTITISGYGSTLLTAQDGASVNTNMTSSSQAFNSPIASPLSVYSRGDGSGTCYTLEIPNSELSQGGQDLYITIKRPGQSTNSQPYYGYLSGGSNPGYASVIFCSEVAPQYKYGPSGDPVVVPGMIEETGGSCLNDSQCEI